MIASAALIKAPRRLTETVSEIRAPRTKRSPCAMSLDKFRPSLGLTALATTSLKITPTHSNRQTVVRARVREFASSRVTNSRFTRQMISSGLGSPCKSKRCGAFADRPLTLRCDQAMIVVGMSAKLF